MKALTTLLILAWSFLDTQAVVYSGTGSMDEAASGDLMIEEPRVVLGGLFPIHQNDDNSCGRILDLGIQRQEAMVFAVQKINRDPQLLPGVTLAFEIRDTCTQTNYALEQSLDYISARTLHENETVYGISGVVGAASSSVSIAVANLLRLFHIPQVSYASTARILSDKTRFDYLLRTVPPDLFQAKAMADIVSRFNWTYIVAINSDDAYGAEGIQAFIEELEGRNETHCIAVHIQLPVVASSEDFDRAVQLMHQEWVRNASVVVLFGQLATAIGVLEAVKRRQSADSDCASKPITWIGSDAWGDQLPAEYHSVAQGLLSVIPKSRLSSDFDEYFQALNPTDNNSANPWFREYWEFFFNCTFDLTPGFTACDPSSQRISFESGYRQNSKVPFTIDAVYAFAHAIHRLQRDFCNESSTLCPEIIDNPLGGGAIKGDLLLQYLHNISFPGVSTDVIEFDENGDQGGGYLIKNLQSIDQGSGYTFEIVGSWDSHDRLDLLDLFGEIEWNQQINVPQSVCSLPCGGGEYPEPVVGQADCCWVCMPCRGIREFSTGTECVECGQGYQPNSNRTDCILIPPTFLMWSSPWSISILLLTCTGILATSLVTIIFIVFHKRQIVKASSRELSAVLLTGLMLCYLLPFFFIAKPSALICAIRRFGVGFCFAVCYSALLVKTNRIHRIFNRAVVSAQKIPLISPQSQLFFTGLLVLLQVVIAVVWLVVEKPGTKYVYSDFSTELQCGESTHIGLSVSLGYNLLLLLFSTYYAFRARKIPQNYNEAKFINLTLYTLCIVWLAFIPTYFATANLGTVYQTSSQIIAITLSATTTLCCLFMPKVYFLFSQMRKEYQSHSGSFGSQNRHNNLCGGELSLMETERRRPSVYTSISAYNDLYNTSQLMQQRSDSLSIHNGGSSESLNPNRVPSTRGDILRQHFELPVLVEEEETKCVDTKVSETDGKNDLDEVSLPTELVPNDHGTPIDSAHPQHAHASTQTAEDRVFLLSFKHHSAPPSMEYIERRVLYQHVPLPSSTSSTPYSSLSSLSDGMFPDELLY